MKLALVLLFAGGTFAYCKERDCLDKIRNMRDIIYDKVDFSYEVQINGVHIFDRFTDRQPGPTYSLIKIWLLDLFSECQERAKPGEACPPNSVVWKLSSPNDGLADYFSGTKFDEAKLRAEAKKTGEFDNKNDIFLFMIDLLTFNKEPRLLDDPAIVNEIDEFFAYLDYFDKNQISAVFNPLLIMYSSGLNKTVIMEQNKILDSYTYRYGPNRDDLIKQEYLDQIKKSRIAAENQACKLYSAPLMPNGCGNSLICPLFQ